jgi:hypothetical protein
MDTTHAVPVIITVVSYCDGKFSFLVDIDGPFHIKSISLPKITLQGKWVATRNIEEWSNDKIVWNRPSWTSLLTLISTTIARSFPGSNTQLRFHLCFHTCDPNAASPRCISRIIDHNIILPHGWTDAAIDFTTFPAAVVGWGLA